MSTLCADPYERMLSRLMPARSQFPCAEFSHPYLFPPYPFPATSLPVLPPAANLGVIRTFTPPANVSKTFYFRKSVTLSRSACIQGLIFDFIPKDGFSLFINNVEAMRYRMPAGTLYVDSPVSPVCISSELSSQPSRVPPSSRIDSV